MGLPLFWRHCAVKQPLQPVESTCAGCGLVRYLHRDPVGRHRERAANGTEALAAGVDECLLRRGFSSGAELRRPRTRGTSYRGRLRVHMYDVSTCEDVPIHEDRGALLEAANCPSGSLLLLNGGDVLCSLELDSGTSRTRLVHTGLPPVKDGRAPPGRRARLPVGNGRQHLSRRDLVDGLGLNCLPLLPHYPQTNSAPSKGSR